MLADVARAGAFFTVATGAGGDPSGRHPVGELYAGGPELAARIAHVRRALGSDDRVAASITFQGLAALLVSAPFAAAVVHATLPELTPRTLHWTPTTDGPWPLWCADPPLRPVPAVDDAVGALAAAVVERHLVPLVEAVRAQVRVSPRVLVGNAASTVASARRMVAAQWPAAADRAAAVAQGLLDTGPLAGAGELRAPSGPDRHWSFRRRSCCLYYRARDGGLCGDCVLLDR
ncbi:hypothetical protein GCM10010210_44550 [Pseudonocardia hydrocarbonoxydans]|uniref:Ferric siderophore reductase C-terminal domain-containing protein n=1 Tax=Pseudonocardia hydrocarbonoxydans TaxID=76726 RepID=A0A4Y3WLL5_9PSEU|nr:hypothetical protein PHY01_16810 [Pseudonocardia hydrocarbonoxydans]